MRCRIKPKDSTQDITGKNVTNQADRCIFEDLRLVAVDARGNRTDSDQPLKLWIRRVGGRSQASSVTCPVLEGADERGFRHVQSSTKGQYACGRVEVKAGVGDEGRYEVVAKIDEIEVGKRINQLFWFFQ